MLVYIFIASKCPLLKWADIESKPGTYFYHDGK